MIAYTNADTGETILFHPTGEEGEFIALSPDGTPPAALSPYTLKLLNLFAEARKVNTEEDLKEFDKKLSAAFPNN